MDQCAEFCIEKEKDYSKIKSSITSPLISSLNVRVQMQGGGGGGGGGVVM